MDNIFCPPKFIKYFMLAVICLTPFTRYLLGEYYQSKAATPADAADILYWNTLSHLDAFFIGGIIPVFSLHEKIQKPRTVFIVAALIAIAAGAWNFVHSDSGKFFIFNDLGYNHGLMGNYEHVWHYTVFKHFYLLRLFCCS